MTIRSSLLASVVAAAGALAFAAPSHAAYTIYAGTVENILVGDPTVSQYPGQFYGGNFPGVFPIPLSQAQAEASVLGASDGAFLSLHGDNNTPTGSGFPDAFVEVSFGGVFSTGGHDLVIRELGNNAESATVWLFAAGGGFHQFNVTRGASDDIVVDLSGFTGLGPIASVGIGGLDQLGASWGFDLDSVAIVPEPGTIALLSIGLVALGFSRRRRII